MLPTPPSLSLTLSELARSGGETARLFFGMRALIAESAPGDGHPVLTVPGYGSDDASIATMRYFLRQLGYRAYALKLGANYEDGARDQIRIHRKHCFRYPFEVCDLSYSSLADRSYSQPTGYSPLFRWQENPNPRKINELRLSHRRGAATSGQKMSWGRQTAPRRQRRRPYPERQSGRRWIRGNFHLDPNLIKTGPVDPLMECPDQSVPPAPPYSWRSSPWGASVLVAVGFMTYVSEIHPHFQTQFV